MCDKLRKDIQVALNNIISSPIVKERFLAKLPYQYVKDIAISILETTHLNNIFSKEDLKFKIDVNNHIFLEGEGEEGKEFQESDFVHAKDIISGINTERTLRFLQMLTKIQRKTNTERKQSFGKQNDDKFRLVNRSILKLFIADEMNTTSPKRGKIGETIDNECLVHKNRLPMKLLFSQSRQNPLYRMNNDNETVQMNTIELENVGFINDYFFCLITQVKGLIKEFNELPWIPYSVKLNKCQSITDWSVFWLYKLDNKNLVDRSKILRKIFCFDDCISLSNWTFETCVNYMKQIQIDSNSTSTLWNFEKMPPGECISLIYQLSQNVSGNLGAVNLYLNPSVNPVYGEDNMIFTEKRFNTNINEISATYALISIIESFIKDFQNTIIEKSSGPKFTKLNFNEQNNLHNLMAVNQLLTELKANLEDDNSRIVSFLNIDSKNSNENSVEKLLLLMSEAFEQVSTSNQQFNYTNDVINGFIERIDNLLEKKQEFLSITQLTKELNIEDLVCLEKKYQVKKIYQFPYLKILKLCHTLGLLILFKSFGSEEWFIANPKWFANLVQNLHTVSEDCDYRVEDDLFFLHKSTKVCLKAKWYFSTIPSKSDIFEIIFGIELALTLPSTSLLLPLQLSYCEKEMTKLMEDNNDIAQVSMIYTFKTKLSELAHWRIIYYINLLFWKNEINTTISDLYYNWITFYDGPAEASICFNDDECKSIKICCRILKNENSPSILAHLLKQIETAVEYSLKISSVYFSKILFTPWGNVLIEPESNDTYSTEYLKNNLNFFNNFNVYFEHELHNIYEIGCVNKCNLRRQHFLWKMHKQLYPTFKNEILFEEEGDIVCNLDEILQTSTLCSNMNPVNFYSITLRNCSNLKFELAKDNYSIVFNSDEKRIYKSTSNGIEKLFDFDVQQFSALTIKFMPSYDQRGSYKTAYKALNTKLKLYMDNIFIGNLSEPELEFTLKFHNADKNLIIDFTYAPRQEMKHSRNALEVGQKLINNGHISTVENFKDYLNLYDFQPVPDIWFGKIMSAKSSADILSTLAVDSAVLKESFQVDNLLGTLDNLKTTFTCYLHENALPTTKNERQKYLQLLDNDKIQNVKRDFLKENNCHCFKYLTKWRIINNNIRTEEEDGEDDGGLFENVEKMHRLKDIYLLKCNIQTALKHVDRIAYSIENFQIIKSPIKTIHPSIGKCSLITTLRFENLLLSDLPMELSNLTLLKFLYLTGNLFENVPKVISQLSNLTQLNLDAINFTPFHSKILETDIVSLEEWKYTYNENYSQLSSVGFDEGSMMKLFKEIASDDSLKSRDEIQEFHAVLYKKLPRITSWNVLENLHKQSFKILVILNLKYTSFQTLDDSIEYLENLHILDISFNLLLEEISPKIAYLPLQTLYLENCPSLRTPPKVIAVKSLKHIQNYMRALDKGYVSCKRTKLMLVGLGGGGKTSLMTSLTENNQEESEQLVKSTKVTDGICIRKWLVQSIEYSIWDFAGQTVYYNTHQFFLSNRAVYFLVWNVRSGEEHAGLKFWLNSIKCHAPKAPVFIVGTHIDQVEKSELPTIKYQEKYPQIKGFYNVSSLTKKGLNELVDGLINITINEKYMNEKIPNFWLDFEEKLYKVSKTLNIISIEEAIGFAEETGIIDKAEFYQAVEFLHELGSIQYFQNEYLRKQIIINPQWIVDVMACVVSVQENSIKNGKLLHDDLNKIWPSESYSNLHKWLLRLTEEFDLTFSLKNERASLVPCLLPDIEPENAWEKESLKEGESETKMVYKFDYLPFGLFNRVQVRLFEYGDEFLIWKTGSYLTKNGHRGILKRKSSSKILIKVRGFKPENVLFLVHEVLETLIAESFQGVEFNFMTPCPECIYHKIQHPSMVESWRIRKAMQLKIPFLQCTHNFHTVSITQLQNMLPPESSEELDMHLQNAVRELKKIQLRPIKDVLMLYCLADVPSNESESCNHISALRIKNELEKAGFYVKMFNDSCENYVEEAISSLKSTQVVLTLMTDDFIKNSTCRNLFIYTKKNLAKQNQLILIKESDKWKKHTDIGMLCSDDIYINMQNVEKFSAKMNDLKNSLSVNSKPTKWPPCFISYCWSNSQMAINKGTKMNKKALGKTDPRLLKDKLEEAGINCWMDIEQVNRGGLFQDIAEGLKKAKIVVACVSDEYILSKNCQMEFRFASLTLRLPIILAIVGTGKNWIQSEIGMISLSYPRVNLQEMDTNIVEVVNLVKEKIGTEELDENVRIEKEIHHEEFTELLELAERKLLRQLATLQNLSRGFNFPHIPILDYSTNSTENTTNRYRFVFLCECDQGWHLPDNHQSIQWNVPFESREAEKYMTECV
ncbi:DgyrCDS14676 [Dimorphilus gyrociliatus]|uniref:non-specific serine/threonine protein kinase n=1 Tax=Dimorphilus gyrociliatus TaxID=2664684 RepID=A0A7I8WET2_9ANNE|nr:DgyrCDS14676 [Dimorphilus gyrociliatus]